MTWKYSTQMNNDGSAQQCVPAGVHPTLLCARTPSFTFPFPARLQRALRESTHFANQILQSKWLHALAWIEYLTSADKTLNSIN